MPLPVNRTTGLVAIFFAALTLGSAPARSQNTGFVAPVQTPAEAMAFDAAAYAQAHQVSIDQALHRLQAELESVATTDRLRAQYRDRLAGISIEDEPEFRIAVLLTGQGPVAGQSIVAGGMRVPIVFRTGARATRQQVIAAMWRHQGELAQALPDARGAGLDQRTGDLVLLLGAAAAARYDLVATQQQAEALTGVPVQLRLVDGPDVNMAVAGGSRIDGIVPGDGKRYICTTGFVVTDGAKTGLASAAHCPDAVTVHDPDGGDVPLPFVGQWGARYQDVQINAAPDGLAPLFYADRHRAALRPVTSWRNRASTRAGDTVCHWGEGSGYSCSEVELTDFAPPGALCGGQCEPVWMTVRGPSCHGGDSGGPVFLGTVALGIFKGGNRTSDGRCIFYYYMSTDFLPAGWSLLAEPPIAGAPAGGGSVASHPRK